MKSPQMDLYLGKFDWKLPCRWRCHWLLRTHSPRLFRPYGELHPAAGFGDAGLLKFVEIRRRSLLVGVQSLDQVKPLSLSDSAAQLLIWSPLANGPLAFGEAVTRLGRMNCRLLREVGQFQGLENENGELLLSRKLIYYLTRLSNEPGNQTRLAE
jgi:hypothetical protein